MQAEATGASAEPGEGEWERRALERRRSELARYRAGRGDRAGPDRSPLGRAVDAVVAWARSQSLAPYVAAGSCCAPELDAAFGPRFDLERLGVSGPVLAPEEADLLVVAGPVAAPLAAGLRRVHAQMRAPRWVVAFGACAVSGGPFLQPHPPEPAPRRPESPARPLAETLPVDLFVPGCPPHPAALVDGLLLLQERIRSE